MKKKLRYGTILVDSLTHQVIDLIDSRETEAVSKWLAYFPNLLIVSRDGSNTYKKAIETAHPQAIQVNDRFHLIKNLTDYIKTYWMNHLPVNVPLKGIKQPKTPALSLSAADNNRQLSAAEKARRAKELNKNGWTKTATCRALNMDARTYDKLAANSFTVSLPLSEQRHNETVRRKEKVIHEAMRLKQLGYTYSAIGRELDKNPITIKRYITKEVTAVSKATGSKKRASILSPFYTDINLAFEKGLMASTIEELIRQKGYKGSSSLVRHYVSGMKKDRQRTNKPLSPRYTIQRSYVLQLLYQPEYAFEKLTPEESQCLFEQYPFVKELYDSIQTLKKMLETHDGKGMGDWLVQAEQSPYKELHSFVDGTKQDLDAVLMAIQSPYSNGLVEGSINKLKVIKRIMYGRCSFALLRNKVLLLERFHSVN